MDYLPLPIERLTVSAEMDGSRGSNRALGNRPQISANDDLAALHAWLARYADTKTTFNNYRKEAERLLLWSTGVLKKPLSSITHEDLLAYQEFLTDPQPSHTWVVANGFKAPRDHPAWRPFAGPLSKASQRQTTIILNAMFSWLVTAGYLAGNPLALARQRTRKSSARVERYLSEDLWDYVKAYIVNMPLQSKTQVQQATRARWVFTLLYLCGLRISEIANNTMGGFFSRNNQHGARLWWLEVVGKGDKKRIIPVSTEFLSELSRYRQAYGLSVYPQEGETTPLLLTMGGKQKVLSRAAIHDLIKHVFREVAASYRSRGPEHEQTATHIERASAHWLRHTAGSHMANNNVDLRHVRENLGHESLTTTDLYLHSEDDARHKDTVNLHKIKW